MKRPEKRIFLLLAILAFAGISGILPHDKALKSTGRKAPILKKTAGSEEENLLLKTYDKTRFSATEQVSIRILSQSKAKEIVFAPETGSYFVIADGKNLLLLDVQNALKISVVKDSLEVKSFEKNWGKFASVKLYSPDPEKTFKIKCLNPEKRPRFFNDNLAVTVENDVLRLINESLLDNYIAGVSEAESGSYSQIEFYKVQAILARTYALTHITKHQTEGFNLCDQVHCQAFFGKSSEAKIIQAVNATKGKVVVDEDMNLIVAVFHSNSGGQTANSEDVWGKPTSYLRSIIDTFSYKMPNARWQRKIAVEDWLDYLKIKHSYPVEDSVARWQALHFKQETRKVNLEYNNVRVPLKNVRADFQLKSTFFSLETIGDTVVFSGRGFGHGIGMCQEGAMRMTKLGYNYKDVLNFYYKDVHLIDLKDLNFFRE
ncbi:MAG TPA: SpoIID/LytB domain-containing protein [Bacteroidia bacterium]|jgi:stage II sporulation protein D|nr:SpoIID/LytB domain-containing protein [Bacteroidia bacterium]